jgi:hypothetical protein
MYQTGLLLLAALFSPAVVAAQQPCTTDARQVVNELYRHLLERQAGDASAQWVNLLESGQLDVRDVVRQIAKSPEHTQRFHYTEAGEATPYERSVARLYRHLLGRQPDADGQRSHAELAQQAGSGAVVDRLIDSAEYDQMVGDWGVPGSGGIRYCPPSGRTASQDIVAPVAPPNPQRFRGMDRNNDGAISRSEWRGNRRSFDVRDWNNDGVLTGDEVNEASARIGRDTTVNGTSGQLIRVDATERWTDTGIDVRAGDTLGFDAQGTVRLSDDSNDTAGIGGTSSARRVVSAPLRNQSVGALIARIDSGEALFIGNRRSLQAPANGRLYLGVNDAYLGDNTGNFQVVVTTQGR